MIKRLVALILDRARLEDNSSVQNPKANKKLKEASTNMSDLSKNTDLDDAVFGVPNLKPR